jgi:hypothetical protein
VIPTARIAIVALLAGHLVACGAGGGPDPGPDASGNGEPRAGISWRTPHVLFKAHSFRIDAGGQAFFGRIPQPRVHSDFLAPDYTTLEVTWLEHEVEMRLYIYFSTDGSEWWSNELRTYDGNALGDWITYTGDFFRSALGQPFTDDIELTSGSDALLVRGLELDAFLPVVCDGSSYFLEPYDPTIWLVPDNEHEYQFHQSVFLRDATCTDIAMPAGATLEWTIADPTIATIVGDTGFEARLNPVAIGETTAQAVLRATDGTQLAATTFAVLVRPYP